MAKKAPKAKRADKPKAAKVKAKAEKPEKKVSKKAPETKPEPKAKGGAKPKAEAAAAAKIEAKVEAKKKVAAKAAPESETLKAGDAGGDKPARKGITIVSQKPVKKAKAPSSSVSAIPAGMSRLLDPKGPSRKPLIPSGPKAAHLRPLGQHGGVTNDDAPRPQAKSPFNKKELEHFRQILLAKRKELFGDISTMETQALRGQSGSLSNMPQHLAEQGSEAYDQSLSLDLAAADRKLIREIDDALARIADGTYGICELTGKPIKQERLEELPWARYSIEAARELERQSMRQ
ncbi:MAG TPA: TraR/DksA C4-type zinc finger protein [Phycisphaerales bacterium]|nr:TraR/DksA C4-type zinc finger protein [Phycisphaerales bacterium]